MRGVVQIVWIAIATVGGMPFTMRSSVTRPAPARRRWLGQNAVQDGKDRGITADDQRNQRHDCGGEPRRPPERAHGIADVADQVINPRVRPASRMRSAMIRSAELDAGASFRLVGLIGPTPLKRAYVRRCEIGVLSGARDSGDAEGATLEGRACSSTQRFSRPDRSRAPFAPSPTARARVEYGRFLSDCRTSLRGRYQWSATRP